MHSAYNCKGCLNGAHILQEEAFSNSDLPFKVDIVDWAGTDAHFQKLIQKAYEVIQPRTQDTEQRTQ